MRDVTTIEREWLTELAQVLLFNRSNFRPHYYEITEKKHYL